MDRADALGVLIAGVGEGLDVGTDVVHVDDLVGQACLGAELRAGLLGVVLDQRVHLVDGGLQILAGLLFLHETAGIHGGRSGLAVHDVDLGGSGADGEGVVVVALRAAEDVVRRGGALAERDLHHRQLAGLDGVDQALAEAEELSALSVVADVDTGGILDPQHRDAVTRAEGDKFVHLDEALTVQLAAHAHRLAVSRHLVLWVVHQHALIVGDNADEQTVDLGKAGDHLGAVAVLVLHELGAVEKTRQNFDHVVGALLVERNDAVEVVGVEQGLLGIVDAEELGIVSGQHVDVLADTGEHALFIGVDLAEEAGLVIVDGDSAGDVALEVLLRLDERLSSLLVDMALGAHTADDTGAADCHVGILMRDQDGRGDGVIAAAGGVRAVDADDDGHAHLVELAVAIERRTAAAAVGVHLLLLVELNAGAVQHVHEGNAQALGRVAAAQQAVSLAGDPGARELLVVARDDDGPFAVDTAEALDDANAAVLVVLGVIEAVEGAPGAFVNELHDALHRRPLAGLVERLGALTGFEGSLADLVDLLLHRLDLSGVVLVECAQILADDRHALEIRGHGIFAHIKFSFLIEITNYLSLGTLMNAWPGSISSRMRRMISGEGPSISSARETSISKPVFS